MKPSRSNPAGLIAAAVLFLLVLAAVFPGLVGARDPLAQSAADRLQPPGRGHIMGTDGFGRDVASRVVHGARVSLGIGFLGFGVASALGILAGTFSAYRGGAFDLVFQRLIDMFLGFPFLVLALVMVVGLGPSAVSIGAAIAVALAPQVSRVARAATLQVRVEPYVEAARLCGAGTRRIVFRHLLPNTLPPIIGQISSYLGTAVAAEATLSFLGLGISPPFASWGLMLQEGARQYLERAPWIALFPGLALSITVLCASVIGDSLRDSLDIRAAAAATRVTEVD